MTEAITKDTFKTTITARTHSLISDEPLSAGGSDEGMMPTELLEASLASCSTITLRMYINRKEWEVDEIRIGVNTKINLLTQEKHLEKKISIIGDIDEKQLKRLLVIAGKCPIHKMLSKSIEIKSSIVKEN